MIEKKKRKKKSKNYFTKETEEAILAYNRTDDYILKDRIYTRYIHYPFFKLTQNIIHTFKFYYTEVDNLEHLQHEIIIFLIERLHKYHHSKSVNDRLYKIIVKKHKEKYIMDSFLDYTNNADQVTQQQIDSFINDLEVSDECYKAIKKITPPKAFSYFGTIVKNYLIPYNNENYENKIKKVDASEELNKEDTNHFYVIDDINNDDPLREYVDLFIEYCDKNLYKLFPKGDDAKIADSILELFRKRDNIEIFNKKALYIYIREMVDAKTPKITKISKQLHTIFNRHYSFYLENGYAIF